MARFNCLPTLLIGKKKKSKELPKAAVIEKGDDNTILLGKKEYIINPLIEEVKKESSFDASLATGNKEVSPPNINTHKVGEENSIRAGVPPETAYEGGDEHDDILSMKRDFSDFDLQALAADNVEVSLHGLVEINQELNKGMDNNSDRYEGITPEGMIYNGHVSDPGMGRTTALWGSPTLKRSCSNIEAKRVSLALASPTKTHSYGDLQILSGNAGGNPFNGFHGSPHSLKSNCSADRVMLKKRSSSQVLPSRSRRLWWKLFLWSHRNLHRSRTMKPQRISSMNSASQKKEGYTSDTLEPSHSIDRKNKLATDERGKGKLTDMLPQNQWVAFSAESSSLDRVNAWVSSLTVSPSGLIDDDDDANVDGGDIVYPSSPEIGESSGKNHTHAGRRLAEEVVQANSIIQSLNSFSSVAHISGMGLKVIPAIAAFSSLRSVNLSGNYIAHITPGSLPKSLHTLDLSRNKIATIEGLRDLTRLRVLNLSYNRIARIGHGLSNCTLIKELYLAGNKISDVEGLHRLLKLTVLDLSFNKITTAKALGQLVANYSSLLAINLLGNPIQTNIGDDQLRKAVTGLLPQLAYLNKQPIKSQRAREVATDSIAKAALGNGGWSSRRRCARRVSQGLGSSISGHRAVGSGSIAGQNGSRNRSKSRQKH